MAVSAIITISLLAVISSLNRVQSNEFLQQHKLVDTEENKRFVRNADGARTYTCGSPAIVDTRIVGGNQSVAGKWPWQVLFKSISNTGSISVICGGSIINTKWIVTAAHCTAGQTATTVHMGLGVFNHQITETHSKEFPVAKIVDHPDYNNVNLKNDISLIKIGGEVTYTDYIIPVCLPSQSVNVAVGLDCWITGWGVTESPSEVMNILREAIVPILDNTQCNTWYSGSIHDVHVCAGYAAGGIDTCQGDSGGPLFCRDVSTSPYTLQGITSFGRGCADPQFPGVYTRVSEFADWIDMTILSNSVTETFFGLPETACGTIITSSQQIRLPVDLETQLYPPHMTCMWTLRTNTDVTITFVERFTVEILSSKCSDYVRITTNAGVQVGTDLCGFTFPSAVFIPRASHTEIYITFSSDVNNQYEGFAADVLCENITSTTTTPAATTSTIGQQYSCGVPVIEDTRIVGGNQSIAGKWPWQVLYKSISLVNGGQMNTCGGSLLNSKWVVTAAHCAVSSTPVSVHIIAGAFNHLIIESQSREFPVSKIINHPQFDTSNRLNDISLIKLGGEVTFSDYIIPVCLPTQGVPVVVGLSCWITGWGNTEVASEVSYILREAVVPIMSNTQCNDLYNQAIVVYDEQLCAGFVAGGVDTCDIDKGGPLFCRDSSSSSYTLEGITSFGIGCADPNRPGVYTRISEFVTWIDTTISQNPGTETFFAIPQTSCGSVITTNQRLKLPVDAETHIYQSNTVCVWTLKPSGLGTTITFVERFAVERLGEICYDFVAISTNSGSQIGTNLCGYSLPGTIYVPPGSHTEVIVTFTSDNTVQYEGFAVDVIFNNDVTSTSVNGTSNVAISPTVSSCLITLTLSLLGISQLQ